jgi:hypothetical protein
MPYIYLHSAKYEFTALAETKRTEYTLKKSQ